MSGENKSGDGAVPNNTGQNFRRWAEKVELYWQGRPLRRSWGAWISVSFVFLLLSFIPFETNLSVGPFRYVGGEMKDSNIQWTVKKTNQDIEYWQVTDSAAAPSERYWIEGSRGDRYRAFSETMPQLAYERNSIITEEEANDMWSANEGVEVDDPLSTFDLSSMDIFARRTAGRGRRAIYLAIVVIIGLLPCYAIAKPEESLDILYRTAGKKHKPCEVIRNRFHVMMWILVLLLFCIQYSIIS